MRDAVTTIITEAKATREAFEASRARETVLEIKLKGMEDAAARTRLRAGFTVKNLNTHVFGTMEMVEKAAAAEALTASKKRKGKGKKVQDDDQEAVGDNGTVSDGIELGPLRVSGF